VSHPINQARNRETYTERARHAAGFASLGEILAVQMQADQAAQWQLPPALQRHEAERNTTPRHWRVNPQTHKLEEVKAGA